MSKGNVSPTGKTDKHGVANGQPVDHRILTPDEVAAPFPPSGKLPTIREAFLTEEDPNPTSVSPEAINLRGDAQHAPSPLHRWLPRRYVHIRAAISCSSGPMTSA